MSQHFLTHRFIRVMTVIAFAAAVCFSQAVKVKGTVKDISGKAIAGAWAYLETNFEVKKCSTVTDADGKFDLGNPVGVNSTVNVLQNTKLSAHLKDGVLFLNVFKSGPVEITMYTLNGQAVHKVKTIMNKGTHSIPSAHKAMGVYLYRIKTGDNEMMLKSYSIGGISAGSSINLSGSVTTAKKADFIDPPPHKDVLLIKAKGFVDYDIGVNNYDTSYNDIIMLVCEDTVVDVQGNVYQSVKIGNQIWATRSLNSTKFNDGTDIPKLQKGNEWAFDVSKHKDWSKEERDKKAGWCDQEMDTDKRSKNWGKVYNWYAACHPNIVPKGWHVPTREEFYELRTYLVQNGYNFDGTKYPDWDVKLNDNKTPGDKMAQNKTAKSVASRTFCKEIPHRRGTVGNAGNDIRTNNRSGFNCKPLGSRWCDGSFHSFEASCYIWSTTESFEESKVQGYLISFHGTQNFWGTNDHETRTGWQIRFLKDK